MNDVSKIKMARRTHRRKKTYGVCETCGTGGVGVKDNGFSYAHKDANGVACWGRVVADRRAHFLLALIRIVTGRPVI